MDKKLFIYLFLAFIAATIIGTVSHECGHYFVAKYYGYEARINYGMTLWRSPDPNNPIIPSNPIAMTLGGPIETILIGTIGLLLLYLFRYRFYLADKLNIKQWLIIFLSLFWLRQTMNFCTWLIGYFQNGKFSTRGDEIVIANYYEIPTWTIISFTALIGTSLLYVVIFKFIPKKQRLTFMTAGLSGGIAGYIFWLVLFGKYIMP